MGRVWGGLWRSKNIQDGVREHLLYENRLPVLFRTRQEARIYIQKRYGYIKKRKDLRTEPHGWRLPIPIRLTVSKGE